MEDQWQEINNYDFKSQPEALYSEKLVALFDETIAMQPDLADQKAPLDFLMATVKGIIYPSLVSTLMLDFLRLMTMLEFHRLRALDEAEVMYEWHISQEEDEDPQVRFDENDLNPLTGFIDGSQEVRDCFVELLAHTCREDLQRIWLNGSNTQFWVRWDDYFSIFNKNRTRDSTSKPEPFHFKLSPAEISKLQDAANDVIYFMEATNKYSIALKEHGEEATCEAILDLAMDDDEQTDEFCAQLEALKEPNLHGDTLGDVEYYLDYISGTIPPIYDIMRRAQKRSAAA